MEKLEVTGWWPLGNRVASPAWRQSQESPEGLQPSPEMHAGPPLHTPAGRKEAKNFGGLMKGQTPQNREVFTFLVRLQHDPRQDVPRTGHPSEHVGPPVPASGCVGYLCCVTNKRPLSGLKHPFVSSWSVGQESGALCLGSQRWKEARHRPARGLWRGPASCSFRLWQVQGPRSSLLSAGGPLTH